MAHGLTIQRKKQLPWLRTVIIGLAVVLVVVIGWWAYRWYVAGDLPGFISVKALEADPRVDESVVSIQEKKDYVVEPKKPRYLSIPMLEIENARVMEVGVDQNNILKSPTNLDDTAWYEKSMTPGSGYGAVLINGHNGGITRDGVFAEIGTLKPGDDIIIERGDGKIYTYEVVENESMSLEDVNKSGMKKMMQSAVNGKEGLNLITCDGKWVPQIKQFDRRIMLRAVLVQ